MNFEEMVYSGNGKSKLLYTESEDGYSLAVVNTRGTHPRAYVQFPEINKLESYDDLVMNVKDPHCGFTYLGDLDYFGLEGTWIGWDYAHLGDAFGSSRGISVLGSSGIGVLVGKKWTTEEVVEEAREILNELKKGEYKIVVL